MQDGVVTPDEAAAISWLQGEVLLPDRLIASCSERLQRVKWLAAVRGGSLPSIRTQHILESGEICHWDSACTYRYQTRTKSIDVAGQMIVTSKQVYFSSATKSFRFSPTKILDIKPYSNAIEIATSINRGAGHTTSVIPRASPRS